MRGGITKDEGAKKRRHIAIRVTQEQYDKIHACALREGVPVSSLIANVTVDYADKDIDMARQMMASQSRLHSDIRRLTDVGTLTYNLLYSFIYTFFIKFAKDCSLEFVTEDDTDNEDILAKGRVKRKSADRVMKMFNRKFLSDESVRRGILANIAGMSNPELSGKEEKENVS